MTENRPDTAAGWSDPDDAPEWTDATFDAAVFTPGEGVRVRQERMIVRVAAAAQSVNVSKQGGGFIMANTKTTSPKAASAASKTMGDGRTAATSKSAAGSALSQAGAKGAAKSTGSKAASAASATLDSGSTGKTSKTAAASALSQAGGKKK